MKKLLLLAVFSVAAAWPQSDCGNCWEINGGCDPTAICDITGLCQVCLFYIDCDDHNCASGPHFRCVCPWSPLADASCKPSLHVSGPKHIIAKQKEKNKAVMKAVSWLSFR